LKLCSACKKHLPDDAFANSKSRYDGKASTCLSCARIRSKAWYANKQAQKQAYALKYKQDVATGKLQPKPAETPRPAREQRQEAERQDQEPDDFQLVRFTQGEWLFVLQQAQALELKPGDYVRYLVRDAREKEGGK
jgi:hypothetical protein